MIEIQGLHHLVPPELLAGLDQSAVDSVLADVAEAARVFWMQAAGEELSSTRRDYVNGIQPVAHSPGQAVLTLLGVFPNYLENGGDRRDMREFLLGSSVPVAPPGQRGKRESAAGHYYRSIPFRHSPAGSKSKTAPAMGSAYEGHPAVTNSRAMGKSVYDQAKALAPTKSTPYGEVTYGERLSVPEVPKLRPHHKSNIYEGMVRQQKTYRKATQSQYTTWRTISTNPDTEGWIRPAREGVKLLRKVSRFVDAIAPQSFQAYVEGLQG